MKNIYKISQREIFNSKFNKVNFLKIDNKFLHFKIQKDLYSQTLPKYLNLNIKNKDILNFKISR